MWICYQNEKLIYIIWQVKPWLNSTAVKCWIPFKTCSPQQIFHPCFLSFKLNIFPRVDSWKSFSYPRFNKGLNDTSKRQEDVHKSGFLWFCSWIVAAAYPRYYLCRGVEDGAKRRQLSLPLSNSFKRALLFYVSSRRCIFPECHFHCIW